MSQLATASWNVFTILIVCDAVASPSANAVFTHKTPHTVKIMKNIICILIGAFMIFSLAACNEKEEKGGSLLERASKMEAHEPF